MHPKQIVCDVCSETFQESWQFEVHLESHEQTKDNKCDICGKTFFLEWRLKQHMNVHTNPRIRNCHYFNNNKVCHGTRCAAAGGDGWVLITWYRLCCL